MPNDRNSPNYWCVCVRAVACEYDLMRIGLAYTRLRDIARDRKRETDRQTEMREKWRIEVAWLGCSRAS